MKPSAKSRIAGSGLLLAAALPVVQCAAPPPVPTATSPPAVPAAPAAITGTAVTATDLGASWRPGCPVGPAQLRRIGVTHLGFDRRTHRGELIVHQDAVPQFTAVFEQLYRLRYPIEKIRPAASYPDADDESVMADNNTSVFNCRTIPGTGHWAQHAYGRAVDLNPLLNPYLDGAGGFQPNNAAAFLDRTRTDPAMLHDGDAAVRAFTDRGWRWGGHWRSPIDYQHFELP